MSNRSTFFVALGVVAGVVLCGVSFMLLPGAYVPSPREAVESGTLQPSSYYSESAVVSILLTRIGRTGDPAVIQAASDATTARIIRDGVWLITMHIGEGYATWEFYEGTGETVPANDYARILEARQREAER
jgi:hypothetical protein